MPFVDPRRRLLSRWPLFDSGSGVRTEQVPAPYSTTGLDRSALHAWAMVRPGKVVAVSNVHLSSSPSAMRAIRDGDTAAEIIALELKVRGAETEPLTALESIAADGTPVFLVGDFNTPSHLDWTAARMRAGADIPFAIEWPVTRMLADAGLRDSYREIYPDPSLHSGITWTPGAPHPLHLRNQNRIDYVFTGGNSRTLDSEIVGEVDGPEVDIQIAPWPSDHRAVVSTFAVVPATAPPLISVTPRRVYPGEAVLVRTWDPLGPGWTALIVPRNGSPGDAITGVRDLPHDYQRSIPLSTLGMSPGDYDALLVGEDGVTLKRAGFTVATLGAMPEVRVLTPSVRIGEAIGVAWQNAPGALRDWIGLYRAGEKDVSQYLEFVYTEASFDGEAMLLPTVDAKPLTPGDYEVRLMHDETYVVLAVAPVRLLP